ncbi:MAG: amino acid ABC transporter permease [Oscillospiraceae bacterium]|nr:amino acid ABC transporter permease [Oscillospiraceae bacterium]
MNRVSPGELWLQVAPDWVLNLPDGLEDLIYRFFRSLIYDNRYEMYFEGLKNTLLLTFFALMIGIVLGVIVALIRVTWDKNGSEMSGFGKIALKIANAICQVYLTVIRGTPVIVQVMIMYYVIFASSRNKVLIGALSFGINSGAYVAEIIRGGIMSVDAGQMEAGRSLGFGYVPTMQHIILPQAFKNVLPTLANEFIVLLKETSVAGYVGLTDLTYAGNIVGGNSYDFLFPLLVTAIIYLAMVMFFTHLVGRLERRLRNSER